MDIHENIQEQREIIYAQVVAAAHSLLDALNAAAEASDHFEKMEARFNVTDKRMELLAALKAAEEEAL